MRITFTNKLEITFCVPISFDLNKQLQPFMDALGFNYEKHILCMTIYMNYQELIPATIRPKLMWSCQKKSLQGVIPSLLQKLFPSQNIPDVMHTTLRKMLLTVFVKRTLYNQQHVLWPDQLCTRPRVGTMFKALSIKVSTKASSLSFSNLHPTKLLNKKKICGKYLYHGAQHKKNQP